MTYSYNGVLLSHKKKQSTDTCYSTNQPWKHYAVWKKPVTKDHIVYASIYMKCQEQANLQRQSRLAVIRAVGEVDVGWGVGRRWEVTANGYVIFRGDENVLKLDCGGNHTTLWT